MAHAPDYDDRLDHLVATAARVFAEQGYHCTAMRDLARETGMSLAGMYHYVRGKDELLYLIQTRCFTAVLAGAERRLAEAAGAPAEERLAAFIQHHVLFFTRHMHEMKVLSHEAQSLSGDRIAPVHELKRRYTGLLVTLIRAARPEGVDPAVAAYALFGMMNWIYTWYDPAGPIDPEALARQFTHLFLAGLAAPADAALFPGA